MNATTSCPGPDWPGDLLTRCLGDNKLKKYAEMLGQPLEWRYGGVGGLFSRRQSRELFPSHGESHDGVARAYARCRERSPLARMSYVDLNTWLPDDLLVKADRMTMAHSLELRVPFLDHHLVEFAATIPASLKLKGGVTKYLLKKWAGPLLPPEIIHRSKKGFPVPTKSWFRGELAGFARETLFASDSAVRQLFSAPELERLLAIHQREDRSDQIYSLLVLDNWHRQFTRQADMAISVCV